MLGEIAFDEMQDEGELTKVSGLELSDLPFKELGGRDETFGEELAKELHPESEVSRALCTRQM